MNWDHILAAVIGAVASAPVLAWLLSLYQKRHEHKREDRADAYAQQGALNDRLLKQLAVIQEAQSRALVGERTCREELAGMRSDGRWLYDRLANLHAAAGRAGIVTDDLPPLPEKFGEARAAVRTEEFAERQSEHAARLLKSEAEEGRARGPAG